MRSTRPLAGYLFIAPAIVIVIFVSLYPLGYQVWLSLTDWYMLKSPDPVYQGLEGYERLLDDEVVWESLQRTVIWTIGSVGLEYLVALPLALLLNRPRAINGVLSGLILLPWVVPSVVVAYTWRWLLDGQFGTIHYLLQEVGIVGKRSLLTDPDTALWAVIFVSGWKGIPFMTVALLATLKSIPQDYYEAAAVDGANALQRFRHITLPMLRGVSVVMALVLGILAFYSFDLVWIITKGGPLDSTLLIGVYLFRNFYERWELSYAATIGVTMLVLLLIFSGVYLRLLGRTQPQRG
jgi:multiple sugar transport system permease protein